MTIAIGMPVSDETKRRILANVERRARGYFAPVPPAPSDFEEPAQPPPRFMSHTKPDPIGRIHAAERGGRLTPSFARALIALFRQGRITSTQVDDVVSSMSKRPFGGVRGWSDDDE